MRSKQLNSFGQTNCGYATAAGGSCARAGGSCSHGSRSYAGTSCSSHLSWLHAGSAHSAKEFAAIQFTSRTERCEDLETSPQCRPTRATSTTDQADPSELGQCDSNLKCKQDGKPRYTSQQDATSQADPCKPSRRACRKRGSRALHSVTQGRLTCTTKQRLIDYCLCIFQTHPTHICFGQLMAGKGRPIQSSEKLAPRHQGTPTCNSKHVFGFQGVVKKYHRA